MNRILVIGIGSGGADQLTLQAVDALRGVDAFFVFDKGEEKSDLVQLRREICARHCTERPYRFVEIANPARDASGSYKSGVVAWHGERAALVGEAMRTALANGETGAFLVWGDPALYDSTLRILDTVKASGAFDFDYDVIPGVSSLQVLTARHRIALNEIGEPVLVTTGRKLAEGFPAGHSSIVVFLDNGDGLASLAGRDGTIYWGAYLGTKDEMLAAGPIDEVLPRILASRRALRDAKGWIFDVYLVRMSKQP
jgi:precorrin-6A synthase